MNTNRRIEIKAKRWPWQQGYNWRGMTNSTAPLNADGARFGGGWKYKIGFSTGGWTKRGIHVSFDLLFGIVSVTYRTSFAIAEDRQLEEQRAKWRREREERDREDARRREEARERDRIRAEREATRRAALTPEEREAEDDLPF